MGEVYRARDAKLGRDVALKILPAAVAADGERLARFEREARTLAVLNHPHIAQIYGFEQSGDVSALVMELVDGEDLSDRIGRGPLPLAEALPLAREMAEALEFAHAQGVIHRDLKPANIRLRPDGTVKILDFGLAKAFDPFGASASSERVDAATMTSPAMTMQGVILGTAAYMSPEQARGQTVDQRADIWAFGVVFYEMLTGRLAFAAPTVTDTLARVIEREPDWSALPAATPPSVRTLLRRCLEKDPRKRAPHIGLARLDVDDALTSGSTAAPMADNVAVPPQSARSKLALGAAVVLIALVAAAAGYFFSPQAADTTAPAYRSLLLMSENMNPRPPSGRFAISPDGRWLASLGSDDQSRAVRLWLRPLSATTTQELPGSEDANGPFWSPDSRAIGFFANGQLLRIELGGGPPTKICDLPGGPQLQSAAWGPDGTVVFTAASALWRVPAGGGQPVQITTLDATAETLHAFPWFLSARQVAFTTYKGLEPVAVHQLDLESGDRVQLMNDASNVQFATGHLIFMRGTTLFAQRFDPSTRAFAGEPRVLADVVMHNVVLMKAGGFSVSQSGAVVYMPLSRGDDGARLMWITRDGAQADAEADAARRDHASSHRGLTISPDGRRAAIIPLSVDASVDVWLVDLERRVRSRLTHDLSPTTAVWARDGRTLYFSARKGTGALDIYSRGDFGSGPDHVVFTDDLDKWVTSVSADGRTLLFEAQRPGKLWDVFALTLDPAPRVTPIFEMPFSERAAQLSPDGQWIAYTVNDSGRGDDVYIAKYPSGAHRRQVSADGGGFPRWHPSGRELFFHAEGRLMSAAVTPRPDGVDIGAVTPLFNVMAPEGFSRTFYDVTADGRFLVSVPTAQSSGTRLALLTNWPALTTR
jgi:serine/threonine protein kinase